MVIATNKYFNQLMKLIIASIFISWMGVSTVGAAVLAPEIRCVSVDVNGNSVLTWVPPADPNGEFVTYLVYSSAALGGPYTPTPVGNIATTTFTDPNQATLNTRFFYIETVYDDGSGQQSSAPSVTAQSILPVFGALTDSSAVITWNPIFNPNIPSSSGIYQVWRRFGTGGVFTQIGTTNYGTETFSDDFKVCKDTVFYKITTSDQLPCVSESAIIFDIFEDKTAPAVPVLDSVSVDKATGNVVMGWQPSTSPDCIGYIIYVFDQPTSNYLFLDTIYGRFNTFYMENVASIDPSLEFERFTVAAFDGCNPPNISAGSIDQNTIFLSLIPNNCENTVELKWSPYTGWDDLEGYEILVSVNAGPYQVAVSVDDTVNNFVYSKSNSLDVYCYCIRAFTTGSVKTSTSNEECAFSNAVVVPKQQYFKQITVEDNSSIHVVSLTDTTLPVSEYSLLRSLDPVQNFYEVANIPFNNKSVIEFDDFEANVNETSYYYRIGILDTCGNLTYLSKPANSIFLQGDLDDSLNVSLNWNTYSGWDDVLSGVNSYSLYRILDGQRTLVQTISSLDTDVKFSIESDIVEGARFCYEIEAEEGPGNTFNQRDTVRSNQVCFTKNLNVFVPNAFRPTGVNSVFKPVVSFGQLSTFKMSIYDRWGGLIHETSEIDEGWNGTVNGRDAEFGTYVYFITISNFAGSTYQTSGTFVLLR